MSEHPEIPPSSPHFINEPDGKYFPDQQPRWLFKTPNGTLRFDCSPWADIAAMVAAMEWHDIAHEKLDHDELAADEFKKSEAWSSWRKQG